MTHCIRRLKATRGNVRMITSDPGSQLIGASKELSEWRRGWSKAELASYGAKEGFQWNFISANSQHQNGGAEVLIKLSKGVIKALMQNLGEQKLTLNELNTVLLEAAHIVNSRPIGLKPNQDTDFEYLSPNSILLGKNSDTINAGPFRSKDNVDHNSQIDKERFLLCQSIVQQFWEVWQQQYFPSLLVRQKWHYNRRNLQVGDICAVQDSNTLRGEFRLCKVSEVYPDGKGVVRNVQVTVASKQDGTPHYKSSSLVKLRRHVNNLIVLHPVEETQKDKVVMKVAAVKDTQLGSSTADCIEDLVNQVSCCKVQSTSVFDPNSCFRNLESAALPDEMNALLVPNHVKDATKVPEVNQGRAS